MACVTQEGNASRVPRLAVRAVREGKMPEAPRECVARHLVDGMVGVEAGAGEVVPQERGGLDAGATVAPLRRELVGVHCCGWPVSECPCERRRARLTCRAQAVGDELVPREVLEESVLAGEARVLEGCATVHDPKPEQLTHRWGRVWWEGRGELLVKRVGESRVDAVSANDEVRLRHGAAGESDTSGIGVLLSVDCTHVVRHAASLSQRLREGGDELRALHATDGQAIHGVDVCEGAGARELLAALADHDHLVQGVHEGF
mmetsp:Transcript_11997/g.32218  ORF Transcript_11997/g.32218 Transcript_11997/m.32218 type:complete len:260 (+) Transcript_11997:851-1630(+)